MLPSVVLELDVSGHNRVTGVVGSYLVIKEFADGPSQAERPPSGGLWVRLPVIASYVCKTESDDDEAADGL